MNETTWADPPVTGEWRGLSHDQSCKKNTAVSTSASGTNFADPGPEEDHVFSTSTQNPKRATTAQGCSGPGPIATNVQKAENKQLRELRGHEKGQGGDFGDHGQGQGG